MGNRTIRQLRESKIQVSSEEESVGGVPNFRLIPKIGEKRKHDEISSKSSEREQKLTRTVDLPERLPSINEMLAQPVEPRRPVESKWTAKDIGKLFEKLRTGERWDNIRIGGRSPQVCRTYFEDNLEDVYNNVNWDLFKNKSITININRETGHFSVSQNNKIKMKNNPNEVVYNLEGSNKFQRTGKAQWTREEDQLLVKAHQAGNNPLAISSRAMSST